MTWLFQPLLPAAQQLADGAPPPYSAKVSWAQLELPPGTAAGGLKVWNGSAWVTGTMKIWNGSAWVAANLKRWNGSAWVSV